MDDQPEEMAHDELHRLVAEKSRQLSELDVMLADYHAERVRLIRELRRLQARLRDLGEQMQTEAKRPEK